MMNCRIIVLFASAAMLFAAAGEARGQVRYGDTVELDSNVHDFGDLSVSQGPVSCTFTVSNISGGDVNIFNVISTCGCTDVKWTRETLPPGGKGTISATFKNDQGPVPFDKTLTAYISGVDKPVILHLKGVVYAAKKSLKESYPVHFGDLAVRRPLIRGGNVLQGGVKSTVATVANIGKKPLKVSFDNVSSGLECSLSPNPVPPGKTASLTLTVRPGQQDWGQCTYYFTPVVSGESFSSVSVGPDPESPADPAGGKITADDDRRVGPGSREMAVTAFVKEDFSSLTDAQRSVAPLPMFDESSFSFSPVKRGTKVVAEFKYRNAGKSLLHFYRVDTGFHGAVAQAVRDVAPGGRGRLSVELDTSDIPAGEVLVLVTVITNSPERPYLTLYLAGFVE